jgi:transposase
LREVLRYHRSLIETRAAERNRVIKLLESAGIKLAHGVSDVFGVSGMAILHALKGRTAPVAMAPLAKGRLRPKRAALAAALDGQLPEHHRFLLRVQLRRLDGLDQDITALDQRSAERLQPYAEAHARLITSPGVDVVAAATIIAEIGTDMAVFTDAAHLAAWAGGCPGNDASAGRQRGAGCRRGNIHLKTALVGAAKTAVRTKGSYWKAKYHKLKARRGALRAMLAIAHKIVITAYHMLATHQTYKDLGEDHLSQVNKARAARRLVQRLETLGYEVVATPKAA